MSRAVSIPAVALVLAAMTSGQNVIFGDEPTSADHLQVARRVDELLAHRWSEAGVEPAPPAADAEFVRRVCLDLTGVIPSVSRVRAFLDDPSPDKRARLIDELLSSPRYATHMATTWRKLILPRGLDPDQLQNAIALEGWLRARFVEEERYDNIVAEVLVATGGGQGGPAAFYSSVQFRPEELASATSRVFLGMQIQCAQCHDHPFDDWTQEDFWGFAAFFSRVKQLDQNRPQSRLRLVDLERGEVMLPDSDTVVPPRYPGGELADEHRAGTRRRKLAIWLVSRDNPYFARAAVNRVWAQLFGRGLIEPVDDLGESNPASHPQVLSELEAYFVDSGFDLKSLLRLLANTEAYQLSSAIGGGSEVPPELFSRMTMKPLTPEQFYDSLMKIIARQRSTAAFSGAGAQQLDPQRRAFFAKMASRSGDSAQFEPGVPQALLMMNGAEATEATDVERSGLLGALEAPLFSDEQRLEILLLATLSRPPSEDERKQFVAHVQNARADDKERQALSDVLWALINSTEFAMNH